MTLNDLASLLRGKTEVELNEDLLEKANLKPPDGFDPLLRDHLRSFNSASPDRPTLLRESNAF